MRQEDDMIKKCSRCRLNLELELFGSNRSNKDGKNVYCKSCVREISVERYSYHSQWRAKNRDRRNELSRKWVVKNKNKRREIVKKSESKDRVARLAKRRLLYKLGRRRKDYRQCADVKLAAKNRRRARLMNVPSEKYTRKEIFARDSGFCVYCGGQATVIDHIVPISRGGSDLKDNLTSACRPCNTSKSNKTVQEWRALDV